MVSSPFQKQKSKEEVPISFSLWERPSQVRAEFHRNREAPFSDRPLWVSVLPNRVFHVLLKGFGLSKLGVT